MTNQKMSCSEALMYQRGQEHATLEYRKGRSYPTRREFAGISAASPMFALGYIETWKRIKAAGILPEK